MDYNLMEALELLEREKGVPAETILDALANALVSAYKRTPGAAEEARVTIDPDTGEILVYGQELDEDGNVVREWEDTPDDFGRIAAQTAKQVIVQRLRDAKREQVFDLYEGREGDLVTGIVQQSDHRYIILDLGNAEALMPSSERIPYERLERGARVKAFILEVRGETKGPQIVVSRSHPEFIRSLFELEVPELTEGVVEIRQIAREPGHRTKIAVASNDANVDPVGACVGARGSRVRQVVNELRGEKVDIVEWRDDHIQFIAEALSPAKVKEVRIEEPEAPEAPPAEDELPPLPTAVVIVPDHQLSLAIGKEGQNARLAARLTGYRIDIRSESQEAGVPMEGEEPEAAAEGSAPTEGAAAEESTTDATPEPSDEKETEGAAAEESTTDATPEASDEKETEGAAAEESTTEATPEESDEKETEADTGEADTAPDETASADAEPAANEALAGTDGEPESAESEADADSGEAEAKPEGAEETVDASEGA